MTTSEQDATQTEQPINWRTTPHRYVPSNVPGWRTCGLCNIGANGSVHRQS